MSLLGRLPPEVRRDIYKLALHEPEGIRFISNKSATSLARYYPDPTSDIFQVRIDIHRVHRLALLATCKAIRAEAQILFFSVNTFHIKTKPSKHGAWSLYAHVIRQHSTLVQSIGKRNAAAIKQVVIDIGDFGFWRDEYYLHHFSKSLWSEFAKNVELQLAPFVVRREAIRIKVGLTFYKPFRQLDGTQLCRKGRTPRAHDYTTMVVTLQGSDKLGTCRVIGKAFVQKIRLLRAHEKHNCHLNGMLDELLEGLALCRDAILKEVRSVGAATMPVEVVQESEQSAQGSEVQYVAEKRRPHRILPWHSVTQDRPRGRERQALTQRRTSR